MKLSTELQDKINSMSKARELEDTELNYWMGYYDNILTDVRKQLEKEVHKLRDVEGSEYEDARINYKGQEIDIQVEYCLMSMIECGLKNYLMVKEYCKDNNIKGVVDIGTAYSWQSDIFLNDNISYTGVDMHPTKYARNSNNQIQGTYPNVDVGKDRDRLGVAILSLGWNCFVGDGEELINQFKKLSEDFKVSMVYLNTDRVNKVKHLFSEVEHVRGNMYIFKS